VTTSGSNHGDYKPGKGQLCLGVVVLDSKGSFWNMVTVTYHVTLLWIKILLISVLSQDFLVYITVIFSAICPSALVFVCTTWDSNQRKLMTGKGLALERSMELVQRRASDGEVRWGRRSSLRALPDLNSSPQDSDKLTCSFVFSYRSKRIQISLYPLQYLGSL